jgi:DeoR family transcriptional regulator of aga operon
MLQGHVRSEEAAVLRHERLSGLLEIVARDGAISVDDIVATFGVSAATARRDLDDLAGQQLVTRTRGGAVAHAVTYDLPMRYKSSRQPDQKRRIAAAAVELIGAASVVGLNGGTTTTEVGRALVAEPGGSSRLRALTLVTNALNIANELAVRPHVKVVVVGGVLRTNSFELIGPFARQVLDGVSLDVMFLGVDAFSPGAGAAAHNEGEALINRTMTERAKRTYVVADSSKLGQRAFCTICSADQVSGLVTDTGADPRLVQQFRELGLDVYLA